MVSDFCLIKKTGMVYSNLITVDSKSLFYHDEQPKQSVLTKLWMTVPIFAVVPVYEDRTYSNINKQDKLQKEIYVTNC